jgi:hypothetical protein
MSPDSSFRLGDRQRLPERAARHAQHLAQLPLGRQPPRCAEVLLRQECLQLREGRLPFILNQ